MSNEITHINFFSNLSAKIKDETIKGHIVQQFLANRKFCVFIWPNWIYFNSAIMFKIL